MQASLPPTVPFGSSFLIPSAWSAFLRLILQLGVSPSHLRKLLSSEESDASATESSKLEADLWRAFPEKVKHAWQQSSHALTAREAKVQSCCLGAMCIALFLTSSMPLSSAGIIVHRHVRCQAPANLDSLCDAFLLSYVKQIKLQSQI